MTILSAGIIPVSFRESIPYFLILRCYSYWDFPKGLVEDGEDPWQAAKRELKEETNLNYGDTRWGNIFYETEVYSNHKTARYYLAEVSNPNDVKILPNPLTGIYEHHEFRWGTYDETFHLLGPRIQKALSWSWQLLNS